MKKLHKTGIAIISALAPAAALGVVTGVIVNSLSKGEDKGPTKETWFNKYKEVYLAHQADYNFFAKDDIEITVNGNQRTITSIDDDFTSGLNPVREAYVSFEPTQLGEVTWLAISGPTYNKLLERAEAAVSCTYAMDDKTLSIEITEEYSVVTKYVFNYFGYILSYDLTGGKGGDESHYTVTYKKEEPYLIKEYEVSYDEDLGGHSSQRLQLNPSTKYTFNIKIESDINEIFIGDNYDNWIDFTNGLSITHEGTELQEGQDWTWDSTDNFIKLTNKISSGTMVIIFTVPSDATAWRGVYMSAYLDEE